MLVVNTGSFITSASLLNSLYRFNLRASHGRAHVWHLWCRHCTHRHRTLYVGNSRARDTRRDGGLMRFGRHAVQWRGRSIQRTVTVIHQNIEDRL